MIGRKSAIYAAGEAANRLGKSLAVFLLAYAITKEQYGVYSYVVAASSVVTALLDSGLNTLVVLRASVQRFRRLYRLVLLSKLVVFAVVFVGLLLWNAISPMFPNIDVAAMAPFIAISLAMDAHAFLANSLRARLDYTGDALLKFIGSAGFLLLLGILFLCQYPLDAVTALWAQVTMLGFACATGVARLWSHRSQILLRGSHVRSGIRALLLISLPFAAASFCGSFFNMIDTIMLGASSAFDANASFSFVHRAGLMTHVPVGILFGFMLPYLTAQLGRGKGMAPDRPFVDWLACLCAVGAVSISQVYILVIHLMTGLLDPSYSDMSGVASVLSLYILPIYVYSIFNSTLMAARFIVSPSMLFAGATVLSAAVDYIIIGRFDPLNIAWVTTGANWVLLGAFTTLYRARLGVWPISTSTFAVIAVSAVTGLLLLLLPDTVTGVASRSIIFVGTGALALVIFRRGKHHFTRMRSGERINVPA